MGGFTLNYFAIIHTRGKRGQGTRLDSFYFGPSLFECVVVRPSETNSWGVTKLLWKRLIYFAVLPLLDCVQQVHFPPHRGAPDPGGGKGGRRVIPLRCIQLGEEGHQSRGEPHRGARWALCSAALFEQAGWILTFGTVCIKALVSSANNSELFAWSLDGLLVSAGFTANIHIFHEN